MKTFSPYVVVAISLNRTSIAVGVGLQLPVDVDVAVLVGVVVGLPVPDETGNVLVAVLHGPVADVAAQLLGTLAEPAFHDAGTAALRALSAVRKAAYDHVRSAADSGLPSERPNCSARLPFCGVYFSPTAM